MMALPRTLRENSTWTPKSYGPSNQKIFHERMNLIKKWYSAWNESQRWTLLEYLLRQQNDTQLSLIHSLLHPAMPPPDHDFTRVLPRCLNLKIFSLLDPQSLCRAAQVSWFWKFLAESNSLWKRKCLKLGWFLPTPPYSHDYTVWKRHYIACVCQLHWNPPQAPEDDISSEQDEVDMNGLLEEANKRQKKRSVHRHTLSSEERKPWRDPDKHPHDTYFTYSDDYYGTLLAGSGHLGTITSLTDSCMGPVRSNASVDGTTSFPPPDSLIHPILLEKMRLGSPSSSHIQLSTLNSNQSQQDISEAFYDLHKTTPFPRLPPYYVHKPGEPKVNRRGQNGTGSNTSSRPPSGRIRSDTKVPNTGKVTMLLENSRGRESGDNERTSPQMTRQLHTELQGQKGSHLLSTQSHQRGGDKSNQEGLRSNPWTLPESDDDM